MKGAFGRRPLQLQGIFATDPLYFVTFCTHERQRFLAKDGVHTAFVLFAKRAEETFNVAVGRYVIMPNHFHLFVRGDFDFMDRCLTTSASERRHMVRTRRTERGG